MSLTLQEIDQILNALDKLKSFDPTQATNHDKLTQRLKNLRYKMSS